MSYCLKIDEGIAAGIRRIAREQLEGALCEISQVTVGREAAAVHATRKHLKKARALLRLVRPELGDKIYKEENRNLRDVARSFAGSRDARVHLQVLEALGEPIEEDDCVFPQTSAALEEAIVCAVDNFGPRQDEAINQLQRVCDRIEGWPLEDLGMDDLSCALQDAYRSGRKCFRCVEGDRTAENFHSLRKRVKDIWYQSRILRNLSRAVLCEMEESSETLGQQLGDLHDLAALRNWLEKNPDSAADQEHIVLRGLIGTREQTSERSVLDLSTRFFAEKPRVFERRLLRYAREWPSAPLPA